MCLSRLSKLRKSILASFRKYLKATRTTHFFKINYEYGKRLDFSKCCAMKPLVLSQGDIRIQVSTHRSRHGS